MVWLGMFALGMVGYGIVALGVVVLDITAVGHISVGYGCSLGVAGYGVVALGMIAVGYSCFRRRRCGAQHFALLILLSCFMFVLPWYISIYTYQVCEEIHSSFSTMRLR